MVELLTVSFLHIGLYIYLYVMFVFQIRTVQEMDKELFFFNVLRKDSVLKYWINFVYSKTYMCLS